MGWLIGWIVGKVRWLLVIAAIGGPFLAYHGWQDGERARRILAEGVETRAAVTGATRTQRRRGGLSYTIDLAWSDGQGARRTAEKVFLSSKFAATAIRDDKIVIPSVRIKYLPDDPEKSGVILLDDADEQADRDTFMTYGGVGVGAIGMVGSALFFGLGRRRRERIA